MTTDIKDLCSQLDSFKSRIGKAASDMDDIGARAGAIGRQLKRNRPVRDDSFETDFNTRLAELKQLLQEFEVYVKTLSDAARSGAQDAGDSAQVKNLVFHARNSSLEADKLCSAARSAHREGKVMQLKLNWWMVEAYCSDMEHLMGKLLFAAREFARAAEARSAAQAKKDSQHQSA